MATAISPKSIFINIANPEEYTIEHVTFDPAVVRPHLLAQYIPSITTTAFDEVHALQDGKHILLISNKEGCFYIYDIVGAQLVATHKVTGTLVTFSTSLQNSLFQHIVYASKSHVVVLAITEDATFDETFSASVSDIMTKIANLSAPAGPSPKISKNVEVTCVSSSLNYVAFTTKMGSRVDLNIVSLEPFDPSTNARAVHSVAIPNRVKSLAFDNRDNSQVVLITKMEKSRYLFYRFAIKEEKGVIALAIIGSVHDITAATTNEPLIYPHRNYHQTKGVIFEGHLTNYIGTDLRVRGVNRQVLLNAFYNDDAVHQYLAADSTINGEFFASVSPSRKAINVHYNFKPAFEISFADNSCPVATGLGFKLNSIAVLPGTYHLFVTDTQGHIYTLKNAANAAATSVDAYAQLGGLLRTDSSFRVPCTIFASDKRKNAHLFIYSNHFAYYNAETLSHFWCPSPAYGDIYGCPNGAHVPEGWEFNLDEVALLNFDADLTERTILIDIRVNHPCPKCNSRNGDTAFVKTIEFPLTEGDFEAAAQDMGSNPASMIASGRFGNLDPVHSILVAFDVGDEKDGGTRPTEDEVTHHFLSINNEESSQGDRQPGLVEDPDETTRRKTFIPSEIQSNGSMLDGEAAPAPASVPAPSALKASSPETDSAAPDTEQASPALEDPAQEGQKKSELVATLGALKNVAVAAITTGVVTLKPVVKSGVENLKPVMKSGVENIKPVMKAGFDSLKPTVQAGVANLKPTVMAGVAGVIAFTTSLFSGSK